MLLCPFSPLCSCCLVEIKGFQGKDLTIPCFAPPALSHPSLEWSFAHGPDRSHILTYDSRSGHSTSTPPWDNYVELDGYRVPFGDGSLRLMDPRNSKHTGSYTCVFTVQHVTHTEHSDVIIDDPLGEFPNLMRSDLTFKIKHMLYTPNSNIFI